MPLKINMKGWNQLITEIVDTRLVPAAEAMAADCNADAGIDDGYRAGTEGSNTLTTHDYRATVITATAEAMVDNLRHNTLVNNLTF